MSWYNDTPENNFIDATQEHTGGGVGASVSEVTNTEDVNIPADAPDAEEETTIGNVLLPAVFNEQNGTFDLYIRNVNENGRIFLTTKGDGEKIKVEGGKLYVYYDYNPAISLVIPSGWTDVTNYLISNRQGINNNSAALTLAGAAIFDLEGKVTTLGLTSLKLAETQGSINGRVTILEGRQFQDPRATSMILSGGGERQIIARAEANLYDAFVAGTFLPRNSSSIMRIAKIKRNVVLGVLTSIAFGGTLTAIIGLIEYIVDLITKEGEKEVLNNLISSRIAIDQQADKNDVDKIYITGLQIISATNAGMTDGTYEIELDEEIELAIEIKVTNGIAAITDLIGTTNEYIIGDTISINKTELGGTSGTLDINVTQLYSMVEILDFEILKSQNNLEDIDGRQRRRQFIPDKNSFGDGINVVENNITEPSGEITKELDISLKVDTSQFQYDASGNLQIQSSILAPSISTDPLQFTNDPNTGNLQIIKYNNFINLLDHIDTTNNNLVLGNESEWLGYKYDLIAVALKGVRAGAFESSFYNNDWLGYFPALTRLSDDTNIEVVKDVSVQLLDDGNIIGFKKGLVYFKNIDQLKDYDLNRQFEFVCFIKPYNLQAGVEYTLLQTGVKLAENEHDIDNYKLKVAIRDNKLELTHTIIKTISLGYLTNSYNNWADYAVGNTIQTQVVNGNQAETYVIQNGITHTWGNLNSNGPISPSLVSFKNKVFQRDITTFTTSGSAWNGNEQYVDLYFYNDYQATTPSIWRPGTIYYSENQTTLLGNNISKIIIQYKFFIHPDETPTGYVEEIEYQGANQIYDQVEFFLLVNFRKHNDPVIYDSRYYEFDQDAYKTGCDFYEQEIILPTPTPDIATDYTYIEVTLTHRRRAFSSLPVGSPASNGFTYYYKQHFLRVVSINFYEYAATATTTTDWALNTFTTTTDVFPPSYDFNKWYKFVLDTNLANKQLAYYVDDVENIYTFPAQIDIGGTLYNYNFANYSYNGLVRDNDIIIIGNEPSSGQMYFSHFIWKHFQNPNDSYMTLAERNKLDNLINYKYYYENVKVDRYLKTKEFYADVLDARKILVNGNFAFYDLTPAEQLLSLRSDAQTADDLSVGNMYVNIDKLFVTDPVAVGDGFLQFDSATRTFSIGASSVSPSDVENAVGNLIQITPSTYGLIFDTTNPNDKYIKLDDLYVNNLINLVIQNELLLSVGFIDATYGDVLIQIKDASANSPYDLRELDNTDVRYNYVINGNHQYLYRELNQEIQYDPLLGVAFGPQYPVVMYHFQGEIINNARDWIQGIPASDYDFEQTYPAGQVVYGSGPLNKKNFNGVEGGSTEIRTKNTFDLTGAGRSCISFFHKPFGSNVDITDDHDILQIQDVANNDIITFRIEYISNVATYKLIFTDQTNPANTISFTFNNSENEIYFGNENCILLWFDLPNFYWYINGKWHGSIINPNFNPIQAINYVHLFIDLFRFNNRSLLYELKVYPKLLFKTTGTISDEIFNAKRVAEITEMIRIITFNTGGFILKELSGVQETKVRSIETKVRSLSTESRVSVIESKASLPAAGTGVAGYVYNDGISSQYVLQPIQGGGGIDLTAVSTTAVGLDDRKILTFKEIPNGSDFDIKILSRSSTSTSQANKVIDYSWAGITPLTRYDDPIPPYEYTFLLSYIISQMQSQGYFFQYETNIIGDPSPSSPGYSFTFNVLGGDIIKYQGQNGVWSLYRLNNSVHTLIQTFNDGDEFLADNYKYRTDSLYMRRNNDPNTQIRVFINAPYLFADKIELGQEFYMNSDLSSQHLTEPLRNWNYISSTSRKLYNHIITDQSGTIRPLFLPEGDKLNTTNGMPANEDTFFKWSWGVNYNQIACLLESGDLLLNGDIYVNCPTNAPYDLKTGILVNQIDNLVSPNRLPIAGIPPLVEQVYNIELTSWDKTNFIAYFSGTDRVNTYTNQVVSQFEFYYDDTIEITASPAVLADFQSLQYHYVSVQTPSYSKIFNNNTGKVSHKFLKSFGSAPYVDVVFGFDYQAGQLNRISIPINLQDIIDYHNEAFLTTDEYILKYKPHTNTFVWEENIGMAVDSGQEETIIPLGSFKPKTATTQISSRRTLSTAVPIEKVSQKTKYQVFNTEVEINGNLLLEEVNNDVANLFTIYTSEEKQNPTTLVDNFKDKASITLVDATKEWVFKREPESEDIQTATTKFMHNSTTLLTLHHNQVECGVELKVGTIKFADNTTLTTSADLTGLLNDINTTHPSYTEFAKNIKLPNGDIISSVYDDTDVRSVLSSSAGTGLTWNSTNNQFDNSITQYSDADVRSVLSNSAGTGLTWNSTNNQFDNSITQYTDTDVRSVLSSSAGTGLTWNATNNQFDNSITQYTDSDVRSVLSNSAGTGLTWNATNNQFDNSITQYTDTDARSAVYPITQTNSGLPVVNGGMELFDKDVWYNTTDGRNRFKFITDGTTIIRVPDLTNSSITLQIGVNDIFKSEISKNTSYKNLHIGNGNATTPTLFLDGSNQQTISSQIIFGDSGNNNNAGAYKQGFAIIYDSSANYLRISGDQNNDSQLDTPYFFNINRVDGNISIGDNTTETGFKLKVASSIILKSSGGANVYDSQIMFGDLYWLTGVVSDGTYYYNQVQGWWNDNDNRGFRLYNRFNNTIPFFVNSNGNVGINNTAPTQILDIRPSSVNSFVKINTYAHILMSQGTTADKWLMGVRSSGDFSIATDQTATNDNIFQAGDVITMTPTKNVGIDNTSPAYKLDVGGDINTNTTIRTPQIDFSDGSSMITAPFTPVFLKVYFLVDFAAIMTQLQEPGDIAPFFDSSNVPINIGGFSVSNSGISVPVDGYYHIDYSLLMRSRNNGSDRKNIITYIRVNNTDPDGRLQGVAGSYMRFRAANDNCENAQAGNTMLYLTTTDVVSLWGYREGSTGDVFITRAGNIQFKRIG